MTKELITIPQDLKGVAYDVVAMAGAWQINNKESLEQGADLLVSIYKIRKELLNKQDLLQKPHKEFIRDVNDLFKPPIIALEASEQALKGKIAFYQSQALKQANIERQAMLANIDPFDQSEKTMTALAETEADKLNGVSLRNQKVMVVTDESLIPDDYWVLDEVKLRKDLLAGVKVPGAEIQIKKITVMK